MKNLRRILLASIVVATQTTVLAQDTRENAEFKLAVNLYNSSMYDLAVDQFQNFINAYPATANSTESRFYLGLTQMKLKRYEDARVTFQNFALTYTDNPKAPEAWMRVGDAYEALNNDREAASAYERVKIFYPNSPLTPEALIKSAAYYKKAGIRDNSRKIYRTIIQDYPTSNSVAPARLGLGELYTEDNRYDLAQGEFSRVIETTSEQTIKARATVLLGKLLAATGQTDQAETLFARVVSNFTSFSSFTAAAYELGMLFQQSGRYNQAIDYLKKAAGDSLAEQSIRENAIIGTGNTYALKNDFLNALKQYERYLSSFPNGRSVPMIQLKAGKAAARLENHQNAISYFRKVLSEKENDLFKRKAFVSGAESAVKLRDFASAVNFLTTYANHYPSDQYTPEILMRVADLYENQLKDVHRASGFYEDVLIKFPQSPLVDDALFAFARCHESLNNVEAAITGYAELLERYPSSDYAKQAHDRIEFLKNHKEKNRDGGLEKLALLMGDMVTGTSKAQLALKLGEIYFYDLKDYRSAAKQLGSAIDAGLNEDQFVDAYFLRARSYHLLSDEQPDAAGQAILYYESFSKQFPSSKWSDDAALYDLQLKSKGKSADEVIALAQDYLVKRPTSLKRPELLIVLGTAQQSSSKLKEAKTTFSKVTNELASAPISEKAWLQLGKIFARLNQLDSASIAWKALVSKFPKGSSAAEALWLLADLYVDQHKPKDAIGFYKRIASEYYYTSFAMRVDSALSDAYLQSENYDDAVAHLESLRTKMQGSPFEQSDNHQILYSLATAYYRKGDRQKADELYRTYLQNDTKSSKAADAYYSLGVIARDLGKMELATAYFRQAASINGDEQSNREIAELLFNTEQYAQAELQFVRLAKMTKKDEDKRYCELRVIICKLRANDLKDAEPLVKEFSKTYKKNEEALAELSYEQGLYYYRNQEYDNANTFFKTITDDYDETRFAVWAEFYLGKILEVTNKTQEALKKYESILKRFPKFDVIPRVYLALGNINYNNEKYQDAVTYYQRILESPDSTGEILHYAMENIIDVYQALQLYDGALKVTRDFLQRFPNDSSTMDKRINIGILYTRLGYYDQAIVHLNQLLDEAGSDLEAEIRYAIGDAHYSKGEFQQAILEFLKVPYLVTKQGKVDWTATSFYMAGQSYEKMSKFDQSIAMYQQIIDRPGIDGTFKAAAKKEIDRVKTVTKKGSK